MLSKFKTSQYSGQPLIVVSDSKYLCDAINIHRRAWKTVRVNNADEEILVDIRGMKLHNGDLIFSLLLSKLARQHLFLIHVPREFNNLADVLV